MIAEFNFQNQKSHRMKLFQTGAIVLCASVMALTATAQKLKLIEGDLSILKSESSINTSFAYDNLSVGKFDKESEYIAKKKADYNAKEAGKGDKWAKDWVNDRPDKFEPKFNELFAKSSELTITPGDKQTAKYTLIFKTTAMEPGFNVGISRKNAEIDGEVWIVETANKQKPIAKISVQNALGRTFWGSDYDTGVRLAECYADAGKAVGSFIKKKTS